MHKAELRTRLLRQAEVLIDEQLAWESEQTRLTPLKLEDAILPAWRAFGVQTAQLLLDEREPSLTSVRNAPDLISPTEAEELDEIEISDLPVTESPFSRMAVSLPASLGRLRSSRSGRLVQIVAIGLVLLLLVLAVGGASLPLARQQAACLLAPDIACGTPTPTQTSGSSSVQIHPSGPFLPNGSQLWITSNGQIFSVPAAALGLAPQQCPQQATLSTADTPGQGATIGAFPFWIQGLQGPRARLISDPVTTYIPGKGWAFPLTLLLRSSFTGTITLMAQNIDNGAPASFDSINGNTVDTGQNYTLKIDSPVQAASGHMRGVSWRALVYLPQAGCYTFTASWPDGSWQATIAAGR